MPVAFHSTTGLWSKRVCHPTQLPGSLGETARVTCASHRLSDSSPLPPTTPLPLECRSSSTSARFRHSCRKVLPKPAREVGQGDVRVRNFRMPFLFPLEGDETTESKPAERAPNFEQREISL